MENETKKNQNAYDIDEVGQVQIAEEVVAVIAGIAATEVDGVSKMSGNITNDIVSKLGGKNLSNGVKINIEGEEVEVVLKLILEYGARMKKVSKEVQERVKNSIETMTGLQVKSVNVRIEGIQVD